ncbi:5-oxoprolinase subunit PxpA [Arenicella xantha]|uniref:UPF0271 protein n=1 Tax=Arenicella xantha TaxID=644221 RepID=A0A395JRW7_9GAMM|nr:5-oxoprolinase subunit PxpA [Arenicella xantha]RBP53072.1 UPF0271 protein [Arenicella xantha]
MTLRNQKNQSRLLLNADVGEGLDTDAELFLYLDQANIACGGHAGSAESMRQAVEACIENMVIIGAHPSYPDIENFGRVSIDITHDKLVESIVAQITGLEAICDHAGAKLSYVKFHGALYNDIARDVGLFEKMVQLVAAYPLPLALMVSATMLSAEHRETAKRFDLTLIAEAFADRLYTADGALTPRTESHAVHQDSALILAQAQSLVSRGAVLLANGQPLNICANSVCLHGDNPASVRAVRQLSAILK